MDSVNASSLQHLFSLESEYFLNMHEFILTVLLWMKLEKYWFDEHCSTPAVHQLEIDMVGSNI